MNPSPRQSRARMAVAACAPLFLAAALALPAAAQKVKPTPKPHPAPHTVYRLDYVIRQLRGGKVINQRRYELLVQEGGERAKLSVGNRIPIITGETSGDIQYVPVGMYITAQVLAGPGAPVLDTQVKLAAVAARAAGNGGGNPRANDPVIKAFSVTVKVGVIPGATMTLATMDDVTSNDRYQILVTAVPQRP